MNYTTEQLQLAYARGAEIELLSKTNDWVNIKTPQWKNGVKYRLANPQKDAHLTRFDLYPFDIKRALDREVCIDRDGVEWLSDDINTKNGICMNSNDSGETCIFDENGGALTFNDRAVKVFMKFAQKQVEQTPKKPWEVILEHIKIDHPNKEILAKLLGGEPMQVLTFGKGNSRYVDFSGREKDYFFGYFREKPQTIKVWCVDYVRFGKFSIANFESEESALAFAENKLEGKLVLSNPYPKEYEV